MTREMYAVIMSSTTSLYRPLWLAEPLNGQWVFIRDAPVVSFERLQN